MKYWTQNRQENFQNLLVNETLILPFLIKFANNTASYKFKQIFNVHLNHLLKNCITLIDDKREIDNQVASELILRICRSYKAVIRYLVNRESLIIEWSLTSHQVSQLNHSTWVKKSNWNGLVVLFSKQITNTFHDPILIFQFFSVKIMHWNQKTLRFFRP